MPGPSALPIVLDADERAHLEKTARSQTAASRDVTRAQIVLLAAQGHSNTAIAAHLHISVPTARAWRSRFAQARLAGLSDLPRSGRPRSFPPSGAA